jgi:hypothetical protein
VLLLIALAACTKETVVDDDKLSSICESSRRIATSHLSLRKSFAQTLQLASKRMERMVGRESEKHPELGLADAHARMKSLLNEATSAVADQELCRSAFDSHSADLVKECTSADASLDRVWKSFRETAQQVIESQINGGYRDSLKEEIATYAPPPETTTAKILEPLAACR